MDSVAGKIGNYNGRIFIIPTTNIHICATYNQVARWNFVTRVIAHWNWPRAPEVRRYRFPLARSIFLTRVNIECAQYSLAILQPDPERLCNSYLQMTTVFKGSRGTMQPGTMHTHKYLMCVSCYVGAVNNQVSKISVLTWVAWCKRCYAKKGKTWKCTY